MISSEPDLLIVGHAVEDWIFVDDKEPRQQFGGIYNVARSFKSVARDFAPKVQIEPCAYGHAYIKIDRKNGTKSVHASLNDKLREPTLVKAKWSHYCYLNELTNLLILNKTGILSADLCAGKTASRCNYFDYIFLSSDEHDASLESRITKSPVFISHSPQQVEIWQNGEKLWQSEPIEEIKPAFILGVGDHFASSFIAAKLFNDKKDGDAAIFAIEKCREYLLFK